MTDDSVLIPVAAMRLGYTQKAIERKIESGVWLEKVHWNRAPDGRRFINMEAVTRWIRGEAAPVLTGKGGRK